MIATAQPEHGSPADRGSADAYYERPFKPHYWINGTLKGQLILAEDMTDDQIDEYRRGYENETDRKDWG